MAAIAHHPIGQRKSLKKNNEAKLKNWAKLVQRHSKRIAAVNVANSYAIHFRFYPVSSPFSVSKSLVISRELKKYTASKCQIKI